MLITIGGKAGSGKGTVSQILSERLGYKIISIGDMKRELAQKMGLNIHDFNILGEKPENAKEFDLKYEEFQKSLDLDSEIILDSRLGFFAQPKAFKVLLDVDETIAGERIWKAKRTTDRQETLQDAITQVHHRNLADYHRYIKLYDIDLWDKNNYDMVIDTGAKTPDEVAEIILSEFSKK